MSAFTVASLVPRLLDIHGDARNAQVLSVRAEWRGVDAAVVEVASAEDAAGVTPDLITIGSGFDADGPEVLELLESFAADLHAWVDAGVPLLAIGLGWDLLSTSVELAPGYFVTGLGIFTGTLVASERKVGLVAVESRWGRLVGYEYHMRDYLLGPGEEPIGRMLRGIGNTVERTDANVEGAVIGNRFGTGVRGPVTARNPQFADELLDRAFERSGIVPADEPSPMLGKADYRAERANALVLKKMGLEGS